MNLIKVNKNGQEDFTSLQDAIDSIRVHPLEPVTILLAEGVYEEKIKIPDNKPNVTIKGEGSGAVISYHEYARMVDSYGKELGTFRTPVFTILSDDIHIENVTIQNTAGYGDAVGQALALYVGGDRISFYKVRLLGNQDTLYTSKGRQYFSHCYIEGHVDFIFGSGTTVFDHCEIKSLRKGYITAPSTPEDQPFGFVFLDCILTKAPGDFRIFLGRPWRPFGHSAFIRTWMDEHIEPKGWDNWRNSENEKTARFEEIESSGPGAILKRRVSWSKTIVDLSPYTLSNIFQGRTQWNPKSAH